MSTYEIKSWEIGYDDGVNARNYNAGKLNERQYRKGWEAGDTEISRSAGYIAGLLTGTLADVQAADSSRYCNEQRAGARARFAILRGEGRMRRMPRDRAQGDADGAPYWD